MELTKDEVRFLLKILRQLTFTVDAMSDMELAVSISKKLGNNIINGEKNEHKK